MPKHLVNHPESVVSTEATLTRTIPLASRDAASCAESFDHVDSTREQRDTLDLQNFTSQSPVVAPVAACVRCSKFCAQRAVIAQLVSMAAEVSVSAWGGAPPARSAQTLFATRSHAKGGSAVQKASGWWWWAAGSRRTFRVAVGVPIWLTVLFGPGQAQAERHEHNRCRGGRPHFFYLFFFNFFHFFSQKAQAGSSMARRRRKPYLRSCLP